MGKLVAEREYEKEKAQQGQEVHRGTAAVRVECCGWGMEPIFTERHRVVKGPPAIP